MMDDDWLHLETMPGNITTLSFILSEFLIFFFYCRLVKCTRWAELSESLLFMAELSEKLNIPSEFRLLNGADPIVVGLGDDEGESLSFLREVMQESPAGPTPLCTHITAVVQSIESIEKDLRANSQKAVVVIATDGESSDGNVAEALRPLTNVRKI